MSKQTVILLVLIIVVAVAGTLAQMWQGGIFQDHEMVGTQAPNFALNDVTGMPLELNALRGRYVLLEFWSPHCNACVDDLPTLKELDERYGDEDLVIVGICIGADRDSSLAYLSQEGIKWPQVLDDPEAEGSVCNTYEVYALPTYVLIDREGMVIDRKLSKIPNIPL